ncbi:hypothetical protein BJV74DRAFT_398675 [Russula compacta]|nr:hypothetical protein BJV74DRAFT_398675 [Russula compacta]
MPCPELNKLRINFFVDPMFNIPRLHEFIARGERMRPLSRAQVTSHSDHIDIFLEDILYDPVKLSIICRAPDRQSSSMARVCSQLSPLFSLMGLLIIHEYNDGQQRWGNSIDPMQWLELFDAFPAVQDLSIFDELGPLVAQALQELTGERATQVLPALRCLFFHRPFLSRTTREDIEAFIAACQESNHPVDVQWV